MEFGNPAENIEVSEQQLAQLDYWGRMEAVADSEIDEPFTGVAVTMPFSVWEGSSEERQDWLRQWGRQRYGELTESYDQTGDEQDWRNGQRELVMAYRRIILSLDLLTADDVAEFRRNYEHDFLFRARYDARQGDTMRWVPPPEGKQC